MLALGQLTDANGKVLIPGIYDSVAKVTEEERKLYENIDFNLEEYRQDVGVEELTSNCPKEILMRRWRYPTLSIHGIEGAFHGPSSKTVIPSKVIGKLSLRIVPNMHPSEVNDLVVPYLNELWKKRGSPNKFKATAFDSSLPWVADFTDDHYKAGIRAVKRVSGVEPDLTREGGSIPVTLTFQEMTGKSVMLLGIGAGDDMAHSQNEKINVSNYIGGIKTLASYILECGSI
jgi:nonspecific dipeptidase